MDAIRKDFKKTGKCRLQLARDGFSSALVSFALPKNSKTISKGCVKLTKNHFKMKLIGYLHAVDISINRMLELMQTGIIDHWDLLFHPKPGQCMGNIRNAHATETSTTLKQKNHPPSLSLKNLTGAFVAVLLVGFSISFLMAFLCEQIVAMPGRNRRRLEEARRTKVWDKQVQPMKINKKSWHS